MLSLGAGVAIEGATVVSAVGKTGSGYRELVCCLVGQKKKKKRSPKNRSANSNSIGGLIDLSNRYLPSAGHWLLESIGINTIAGLVA